MKIQLIKPLETGKRYETCISCSLFEVFESIKFESYFKSLRKNIYRFINDKAFIRLYVDESVLIKPSFQKWIMDNKPNLEVYKYEDERFLLKDGIHHDGTFGTMARFLPFFDDKLDVDFIWVTDIDLNPKDISYNHINRVKKANAKVGYTSGCYPRSYIPEDIDYPIFAGTLIISKDVDIPKYGFDKFLKDVEEDKYKDLKEILQADKLVKAREQDKTIQFIYGFDELYLNTIAIKNIKKYVRLIEYNIGLFPLRYYSKDKDKDMIEKLFFEEKNLDSKHFKGFDKLLKLYEDVIVEVETVENKKYQNCINIYNENKQLAKKLKTFNLLLNIKP